METIKILIADNRNMVRAGIIAMLMSIKKSYTFNFDEAPNTEEAIDKVKENKYDIAIVNYNHPKLNGVELTRLFLQASPELKILVIRNRYDYICLEILMKAGIKGFILKNIAVDELFKAVENLMEGGFYYFPEAINFDKDAFLTDNGKLADRYSVLNSLSKRELEVLKYIVDEHTNEEIGCKLFISKRTVDTHRQNLLHKLGVKNTAGLVKYALELKLIE